MRHHHEHVAPEETAPKTNRRLMKSTSRKQIPYTPLELELSRVLALEVPSIDHLRNGFEMLVFRIKIARDTIRQ